MATIIIELLRIAWLSLSVYFLGWGVWTLVKTLFLSRDTGPAGSWLSMTDLGRV
jgi:hypothetical protein